MPFSLLCAAGPLMLVSLDMTGPAAQAPVASLLPGPRPRKESSQLNPQWAVLVSPRFFLSWRFIGSWTLHLVMLLSGLGSYVPEHPVAHLNGVHPDGREQSPHVLGSCLLQSHVLSLVPLRIWPLTVCAQSASGPASHCGLFRVASRVKG